MMGNVCSQKKNKKEGDRKLCLAILGIDNAGKTCTTKGLQGVSLDTVAPTIGFSQAEFKFSKHDIILYDLGGGKRIRDIWKNYFAEVYGVIYVIDSSEPERMEECKSVIRDLVGHPKISGKPFLLLANKQDKQGAMDEIDICENLTLEELVNQNKCPCRVEMCSAISGQGKKLDKSIKTGMEWLLTTISNSFEKLNERVQRDVEEQQEREAQEKKARAERVRKIREERDRKEKAERALRGEVEKDSEDEDIPIDPFKRLDINEIKKKEDRLKAEKKKKKKTSEESHRTSRSDNEDDRRENDIFGNRKFSQRSRRLSHDDNRADDDEDDDDRGYDVIPHQRAMNSTRSNRSFDDTMLAQNGDYKMPKSRFSNGSLGLAPRLSGQSAARASRQSDSDSEEDEEPEGMRATHSFGKSPWIKDRTPRPRDLTPPPSLSRHTMEERDSSELKMPPRRVLAPIRPLEPLETAGGETRRKKKKKAKKNQTAPSVDDDFPRSSRSQPAFRPSLGSDDDDEDADGEGQDVVESGPSGWPTPDPQPRVSGSRASRRPDLPTLREPETTDDDSDLGQLAGQSSFGQRWDLDLPEVAESHSRRPNFDYDDDILT